MKKQILTLLSFLFVYSAVSAQKTTNHLAPHAQQLVNELKASHKALLFIGLHVNPPAGDTSNVIIASTIPEKVGNKSSAGDMEVINKGVLRLKTKSSSHFYEVCLPISTAANVPIGMVVIQIDFQYANSIVDALEKGLKIRNDLQSQIKDKESLFQ